MIDRVYKGWDPGGLVSYLFSSGKFHEHENPRLVASWDGRPEAWQPEHVGPDEFDYDVDSLITAMQAPLQAAGLPLSNPDPGNLQHARFFKDGPRGEPVLRDGTVRHLTLRNAEGDRKLTDAEWGAVAEEVVHRAGWSRRDDPGGARWCAVRHDDDGIHVVAVMVRQDNGRRVWPQNDYPKIRRACQDLEQRLGLTLTASSDRTAAVRAGREETEKAARQGRVPAREELRDAVSQAAAVSMNVDEFSAALVRSGYRVELRRMPSGTVTGYKVARRGDVNRHGDPVWFSGSKLSADLSLPQLWSRWDQAARGQRSAVRARSGPDSRVSEQHAVDVVERARQTVRRDPSQADGIGHALGELLAVEDRGEGRVVSGRGARWDRAARAPFRPVPATQNAADEVRWLARSLALGQASGGVQLAAAATALALQIAALLQQEHRIHQARAARATAGWTPGPQRVPRPSQPVASRGPGRGPVRQRRGRGVAAQSVPVGPGQRSSAAASSRVPRQPESGVRRGRSGEGPSPRQ